MIYLLKDLKANKLYYIIVTFSLIIFNFATSLSITSFTDYYEKSLGSLVGNSKYIYEMQLDGITNDDLKNLSKFSQENFNDINIITDANRLNNLFYIYVLNYKGWNNKVIEGDKLGSNTSNIVISSNDYKIGDSLKIKSYNYNVIGKLDENTFSKLDKYIYIPYDSERDKLGNEIPTMDGVLTLLICSNKKIVTEIDMIKNVLLENNNDLKIDITNKKFEFIKKSFKPNTYFFTRVLYSLCLILISLINLILFISYFSMSKRKEIYTKIVLGASNFNIIKGEFIKLSVCAIVSSVLTLCIQQILNINGISTNEIPMFVSINNVIFVPLISIILVFIIVKFIYSKSDSNNISSILKG